MKSCGARLATSRCMSSSFVRCADCGDSSAAVEWGFVLLARHGWTAQLGAGGEPAWRCPSCTAESDGAETKRGETEARRRLRVLLVDDQVLVLRDGEIVERGNHEELLALQGVYYDLYMSQFRRQEEVVAASQNGTQPVMLPAT